MGTLVNHILASTDDGMVKLAITVVMLIIWGISAMVSAAKKSAEASRRKQMQARGVPPGVNIVPRAGARAVPQRLMPLPRPVPAHRSAGRMASSQTKATQVAQPRRAPVPPPIPVSRAIPAPQVVAPPIAANRSSPSPASNSTIPALATWMTADTIRSQFILTEIFQPPVALRKKKI